MSRFADFPRSADLANQEAALSPKREWAAGRSRRPMTASLSEVSVGRTADKYGYFLFGCSLELGRDTREHRVQLGTDSKDDADDGNRDAGGNQTVLNSGRARLVLRKLHQLIHFDISFDTQV